MFPLGATPLFCESNKVIKVFKVAKVPNAGSVSDLRVAKLPKASKVPKS